MKKQLQKIVSLLLCLIMVFSMAACGNTNNEKESSEQEVSNGASETKVATEEEKEIAEVTIFNHLSTNGSQDSPWFEEYLIENFGMVLRNRAYADNVLQSMIASGELTDIVMIYEPDLKKQAIEAGLLLDLTQYKDQLPNVFENELYSYALNKEQNTYGGVYGLNVAIGEKTGVGTLPDIRWDVYGSVGYPEIESMDALLDVLKQMQDACPETADGEKIYGLGLFPDWDRSTVSLAGHAYYAMLGHSLMYEVCTIKNDYSEEPEYMLTDNSVYYDALKFLFKANQMGILDPDSPTLTWDEYNARACAGRYHYVPWNWFRSFNTTGNNLEDGIGYASLLADAFTLTSNGVDQFGSDWCCAISADTENLDTVLKFIDWVYSYEGQELLHNGPEGYMYEYDQNGSRVMTEEYYDTWVNGTEYNGWAPGADVQSLYNVLSSLTAAMNPATINPNTGLPIGVQEQYPVYAQDKLNQDWYKINGQITIDEYVKEWDGKSNPSIIIKSNSIAGYVPKMSEELNTLLSGFVSVMNTASWKMIYAKDEAEFEKLWENLQKDAASIGLEKIGEAAKEAWRTAVTEYEKLSN